jgi:tetratricopeptide (TPR) repeat protein
MKRSLLIAAAFWSATAGTAWPIDQIFTTTNEKPYFGKITSMTASSITFEPQRVGAGPNEIPVNEVARIVFENSPESLINAQKSLLVGDYERVIELLKKEVVEDKRREVGEEIAFCRAYSLAQLAISGTEDPRAAAQDMLAFIERYPNSFHYFKACELLGDIRVTLGQFADAQKCYAKLSEAPWPDYKIRAQVALGRSYLAQDKAAEADRSFNDALGNDAPGELSEAQRTAARIGKARCMVLRDKADLAVSNLNEILDHLEGKHGEVNALAYNARGTALRKLGKLKEAIRDFLRVHLEYNSQPDLDAEAVANLQSLFTADHKPIHAQEMEAILRDKYKNSRWAKGLK